MLYASIENFIWQPEINGKVQDVPVQTFVNEDTLVIGEPQTHIYLGMGEGRFSTQAALKTLSEMGIAARGVVLPFHHLPCEPVNIERTLVEIPHAYVHYSNEIAGNSADTPVSILGHSQSGAGALMTAAEAPELFDNIGAWSPVGLTNEAFGETLKDRRKEFYKRLLLQNSRQPEQNPITHPGNIVAGAEVFSFIAKDAIHGRLKPKLNYALSLDGLKRVVSLHRSNKNLAIFGGETDPLFRESEYRAALQRIGLEELFHSVPGSHSNALAAGGRKQLEAVASWLIKSRATA